MRCKSEIIALRDSHSRSSAKRVTISTFIGVTGGMMSLCQLLYGESVMPLNEIPKYFDRETRRLVDAALEDAWQELKKRWPC
jgi:hypothetical protein